MGGEQRILLDDALAELQALGESNLPHLLVSASVPKINGARVGGALVDSTPDVVAENLPCRLTPAGRPAQWADAQQSRGLLNYTLVLPRGTQLPGNALCVVQGRDRDSDPMWERSVRVIDSLSVRAVTSIARFAVVDAGPTGTRTR
jgi:hypothetical protein